MRARRDGLLLAEEIGLVVDRLNRPACGEARLDRRGLRWNDRRAPIFVGEAKPPAIALEGIDLAGRLLDVRVCDFLHAAVPDHADKALVQHGIAADSRSAMAQDERVGLHGRRRGAGVRDRVHDREHVFVVDRDDPLERETRAIVPGQRHRLRWGQRLPIGRPHRVEARSFCPCRAYKPGLGPIGVRRAGRREQSDIRALGVDGLVIILENDIVDLAALKIDRAADARRIDDNTGAGRQDLTDSPGGLPYRRPGRRRRGRRAGRQSRLGAGWLGFVWRRGIGLIGLHLRLVLALIQRTGVEILPGGHDQDRQRDREKQVSRVLGFHVRASLSLAVRLAGRRPRPSASPRRAARKAVRTSSTSATKRRPSASRRAIST